MNPISAPLSYVDFGGLPVNNSSTQTIQFTAGAATTLSSVTAVLQGETTADYTISSGTTCVAGLSLPVGGTCAVVLKFTPQAFGMRHGALILRDNSNTVIWTSFLAGHGVGPLLVMDFGTDTTLTMVPAGALHADNQGNVYSWSASGLFKYPLTGNTYGPGVQIAATVRPDPNSSAAYGPDFAIDGAGNIVLDDGNTLQEIFRNGSSYSAPTTISSTRYGYPFISGYGELLEGSNSKIYLAPWTGTSYGTLDATSFTTTGTRVSADSTGNIYFSSPFTPGSYSYNKTFKIPRTGTGPNYGTGVEITNAIGYLDGNNISDPAGNIYFGSKLSSNNPATLTYFEPFDGSVYGANVQVESSGSVIATDTLGNYFAAALSFTNVSTYVTTMERRTRAGDMFFDFGAVPMGTSSPTTKSVTLQNLGDGVMTFVAPLSGTNPSLPTGFAFDPSSTCPLAIPGSSTSLTRSAACTLVVSFAPSEINSYGGSLSVVTTDLAASNPVNSTMNLAVSGVGTSAGDSTSTSLQTTVSYWLDTARMQTLVATVADTAAGGSGKTLTGSVTFTDMTGASPVTLGSASLSGNVATLAYSFPTVGTHLVKATYTGVAGSFASSSGTGSIDVQGAKQIFVFKSDPATCQTSVPCEFTLIARYSNGDQADAAYAGRTLHLTSTDPLVVLPADFKYGGTATRGISFMTAGTQTLTATDTVDSSITGSASTSVTATPTVTALNVAANSISVGSPATFAFVVTAATGTPTGTVSLLEGTSTLGTATLTAGAAALSLSNLSAGSHVLSATYSGSATYATSTSQAFSLTVIKKPSTVTLSATPAAILVGQTVNLSVVASGTGGTPTGSVTLMDGSTALGTVALSGEVATSSISTLAVGIHSLTAIYAGDASFNGQTSTAVTETVADFGLTGGNGGAAGGSISVSRGSSTTLPLTIAPTGSVTFLAPVNLSVSGLPSYATYTLTPAAISVGAGSTPVMFTITVPPNISTQRISPARGVAWAGLLLPGLLALRRFRRYSSMVMVVFAGYLIIGLNGCGTSSSPAVIPQQYSVTLTATSGSVTHNTVYSLTVQ